MNEEEILIKYRKELGGQPVLSEEEERPYIIRAKEGDEEAKLILIKANLGIILKVALIIWMKNKDKIRTAVSFLDLVQETIIGFLRGIEKFEFEFNLKLYKHAISWARASALKAVRDGKFIFIPQEAERRARDFTEAENKMLEESDEEPSFEKIASEMKVPIETVKRASETRILRQPFPLGKPISNKRNSDNSNGRKSDQFPDQRINPEKAAQETSLGEQLRKKLCFLSPRKEKVLRMRFGIGEDKKTLKEAGKELRVTRETIRQTEAKALRKLRLEIIQINKEKLSDYV